MQCRRAGKHVLSHPCQPGNEAELSRLHGTWCRHEIGSAQAIQWAVGSCISVVGAATLMAVPTTG